MSSALIIDIETAGEPWEKIDQQTRDLLVERANRLSSDTETNSEQAAKQSLGFSPLTGQIVALGVLDSETKKGAVYYQAPGADFPNETTDNIKLQVCSEKELLERFWDLAGRYTKFVTYNGRQFDLPYILIRSAIHGIRPSKDLMRSRYLYQQAPNAVHYDLYDQLTYYGALRVGSLHLACRAFGIDSPKNGEIDGSKVGEYFEKKRYQEIARYNAADLVATAVLYERWSKLLAF